jgi:hypothetical protein
MLAGVLMISTLSCKKNFLDQVPDDRITINGVFQSKNETEKYLANIYGYIRDEWMQMWDYGEGQPWLGCADEADMTWARAGYNTYFMNLGAWNSSSDFYNMWSRYYRGIRSATYFLQRVDECKEMLNDPNIGADGIKTRKAETRFLRALFYFNLIKQYGPAILLDDAKVVASDAPLNDLQFPRNSFDECVNYISAELDKAAADLPMTISNTSSYGRPTKGAAMAVKARMLLYAASPLFNGNTDYASMKNADGKQLINQTYDAGKWKKAADAAKAIIDLNQYSLYNGDPDPVKNYQKIFTANWNNEVIFARPKGIYDGADDDEWGYHCAPRQASGWNGVGATQQVVDAYYMDNGKQITDAGSGYVETGFSTTPTTYTTPGTWNMYVNREPRFYASITYNGSQWINPSLNIKVELYNSGASGKAGSYDYSRTGYLVRKMVHPDMDINLGQFQKKHYILFRLGEVYLNYAEALNESSPGDPDILNYVNQVRQRAGIPGLPAGLSQNEMRNRIRRERQIELAFEGLRYFDTRRWKIAEQTDGGNFWGMNVDKGTSFSDMSFYQRTVFEVRVFQKKHYLFPIPQSEVDKDRALIQNTGW